MTSGGDNRAWSLPPWLRELRKATSWHRRLLASGLLAGAVAVGISAVSPPPPRTVQVVVAARNVAGGTTLGADHVRLARLPPDAVPVGALLELGQSHGRLLAAPVRRGETLTDVRLVGASLVASYGDKLVAVPVRVADAASVALLRPGDVIDVLAASAPEVAGVASADTARLVASSVPILTIPREKLGVFGSGSGSGSGVDAGALIVVAATDATAARLAAAAVSSRLSVTLRAPPQ